MEFYVRPNASGCVAASPVGLSMRILNIMLAKARGGVESMAARYHEALEAAGYEVRSLGHPDGTLFADLSAAGVFPIVARFNHDPFAALQLLRQIEAFTPDLILAHGNRATGLCLLLGRKVQRRTIAVMHNAFIKPHLRHAAAAICVSANVRDAVMAQFPGLRTVVVENFLDLDRRPVRPSIRDMPRIGALGRLHPQKGFDLLLEACADWRKSGLAAQVQIAGDGPESDELLAQRDRLGLQDMVTFLGWVSPVADFLESVDLLVVPSRYEPFGLVVIEGLAAGTPVVACDVEGPAEILQAGRFGTLFRTGVAADLSKAVRDSLAAPDVTRQRTLEGQRAVLETYDFGAGKTRLAKALEDIRVAV